MNSMFYVKHWPKLNHIRAFSANDVGRGMWCLHDNSLKNIILEIDSRTFPKTGKRLFVNVNTHEIINTNMGDVISIPGGDYALVNNGALLKGCVGEGKFCVGCGIQVNAIIVGNQKGIEMTNQCFAQPAHKSKYGFVLMSLDHIMPRSKGGGSGNDNKQLMCYHCNQYKDAAIEFNNPKYCHSNFKWPKLQNIVNLNEVYDIYIRSYNHIM